MIGNFRRFKPWPDTCCLLILLTKTLKREKKHSQKCLEINTCCLHFFLQKLRLLIHKKLYDSLNNIPRKIFDFGYSHIFWAVYFKILKAKWLVRCMTHPAQTWEKTVKESKYSWKGCRVFNNLVFELLVTKHGMEFTLKPFLKTTLFIKDKNNSWKERTYCN